MIAMVVPLLLLLRRLAPLLFLASLLTSVPSVMAVPMPFPLPANYSFGLCGRLPPGISGMPGCTAPVPLAPKVVVRCSEMQGCAPGCKSSTLAQRVFSRYEARLGGGGASPSQATLPLAHTDTESSPPAAGTTSTTKGPWWWVLNNTNCNLHDLHDIDCSVAGGVRACKEACAAHVDCGGFLYYSKTGHMAAKNSSCWNDVGPLPAIDFGDDLFIMRDEPPPSMPTKVDPLALVEVCLSDASEVLDSQVDEAYSLTVPLNAPTVLRARSVFGAMHGLESLTQLVDVRVGPDGLKTIPSAPVQLHDQPRFPFRGLMIDSGRHFLPLSHLKKTVMAASMAKLNVIHWHAVDSESFASCSAKFPALCEQGAYPNSYSAREPSTSPSKNVSKATYTPAQMRELVDFAKGYGVRIQPEWDMPGHGSWGMGMPSLVTTACSDALDPTRPELYTFLQAFLGEMASIFQDDYLFLGGDELATDCFDNSPTVAAWMRARGLNASSTQQYFWQQMTAKVFPHLNKTISVWRANDPNRGAFISNLPRGSVLNVYQSLTTAWHQTLPAGVNTVLSMAGDRWYLDSESAGYNQNSWKSTYNFNAESVGRNSWGAQGSGGSWFVLPNATKLEHAHMLGGETAMW
jgi:hypothetical protein